MQFGEVERKAILESLKRDTDFLIKHNLMDYSLLFAVENNTKNQQNTLLPSNQNFTARLAGNFNTNQNPLGNENQSHSSHIFESCEGGYFYYHISIIDYLQDYNFRKKFEHWWRTNITQANKALISCVPAEIYGNRFLEFMRNDVIIDDKNTEAEQNRNSSYSSRSIRSSIIIVRKTDSMI